MDDALAAWLATPFGREVATYKGCAIIPLHGAINGVCTCGANPCGKDNKQSGKHPFTRHGLKDASKEIGEIARLFNYRTDLNLGVVTGEISGFFVLDVDPGKGGFESLDSLIKTYGDLPPTVIVQTGSGGVHIWFNCSPGANIGNRTGFMPGLDIRGNGGYVCAPPSVHASGNAYKFMDSSTSKTADAPEWLIQLVKTAKKDERQPLAQDSSSGAKPEWSMEEVQRMLDVLDPDMGYQEWLETGMALHSGGFSLSIWDSWSRSGEKFENGDCENRWRGFSANHGITMGTLVDMARKHGWKIDRPARETIDTMTIEPLVAKARKLSKPEIIKPEPARKTSPIAILGFNVLDMPGLIGDTVRWITRYAIRKQPELALINALAFAGAVFGRKYASPLNTRTNLYTVGIASTGAGKDASRKLIKELAHAAGLDDRIGADDIRSDSGMLRSLMNNSSQVMMLDEFGMYLQGLSNEKSPHYIRAQAKVLLKLYSASSSVYNHGDYADARAKPIIIHYPNLCIYGTSTEEMYTKALKRSAIESGELNRFITVRSRADKEYPSREMPSYAIDTDIVGRWKEFSPKLGSSLGELANNSDMAPEVITIPWGKCDEIRYQIQCKQVDKVQSDMPFRHLWDRMFENTLKIAMIMAIARNKESPQFEPEDFDIGQMIVESSIDYLTGLADAHMSETPQEEYTNEVVNAIKKAGGTLGRRDLMRKFQKIKRRDLDEIINTLIEQEKVDVEKGADGAKGRPKTYYKIIKEEAA